MTARRSLHQLLPLGSAVMFTAVMLGYCGIWLYSVHWRPPVSMGLEFEEQSLYVASVEPDGPAYLAGLTRLDQVVAIDKKRVDSQLEVFDILRDKEPDTPVVLMVRTAGLNELRGFYAVLEPSSASSGSWVKAVFRFLARLHPFLYILLVAAVLLRRFDHRDAWLMALALSSVLVAWEPLSFEGVPPGMRGPVFAFKTAFGGLGPALFFYFFTLFPARSPFDELEPRVKELFLVVSAIVVVPSTLWVLMSPTATQDAPGRIGLGLLVLASVASLAGVVVSMVGNLMSPPSAGEVPKIQIVAFGTAVSLAPVLLLGILTPFLDHPAPYWIATPLVLATLLLPLTLGYATIARDVSDPSVLLRFRSLSAPRSRPASRS